MYTDQEKGYILGIFERGFSYQENSDKTEASWKNIYH